MNTKRVKVDLQLCRICLGAGRMFDMRRYKLKEPYLILTGLKISQKDGLPQHTCHMCSTMLIKYMMFREKCHKAVKYLKDVINNQITETKNVKSQYTVNKVLGISYTIQQDTNYIPNRFHVIKHENDNHCNGGEININYHEVEIKHDIQINNDYHEIGISNDCDTKSDYELEKENTFVDIKTEAIVGKILDNEDAEHLKKRKNIETQIPRKRQAIVRNVKIKKEQIKPNQRILKSKVTKPPGMSTEEGRQMLAKKYGLKIEVMKEEEERRKDLQKRNINIKDGAKCGLCYKLYENEELLKKHTMKEHDMSKPQCCKYCGYRTDTKRSLHSHTSRNHVFKFTCLTCGLMMRNTSVLAEHHRTHSGQTITCRVCGTICRNTKRYRLHLRKVHPSELKWCNICGEVFISLVNHYTASHPEDLKPDLKCKHCNAYFSTLEALATHTNKHTDMQTKLLESDKPCFYCGESFTNEQNLREHFGTKHKDHQFIPKKRPSQKKKPGERKKTCAIANGGVCDVCGKVIHSRTGMDYHMLIHQGALPHACPQCGKKFRNKVLLMNHLRVHSGERPYVCKVCQKAFSTQAGLYRHQRVHTGEKKHKCDICDKFYSTSSILKAHVKAVHMKLPPS